MPYNVTRFITFEYVISHSAAMGWCRLGDECLLVARTTKYTYAVNIWLYCFHIVQYKLSDWFVHNKMGKYDCLFFLCVFPLSMLRHFPPIKTELFENVCKIKFESAGLTLFFESADPGLSCDPGRNLVWAPYEQVKHLCKLNMALRRCSMNGTSKWCFQIYLAECGHGLNGLWEWEMWEVVTIPSRLTSAGSKMPPLYRLLYSSLKSGVLFLELLVHLLSCKVHFALAAENTPGHNQKLISSILPFSNCLAATMLNWT